MSNRGKMLAEHVVGKGSAERSMYEDNSGHNLAEGALVHGRASEMREQRAKIPTEQRHDRCDLLLPQPMCWRACRIILSSASKNCCLGIGTSSVAHATLARSAFRQNAASPWPSSDGYELDYGG